jgi:histidyl-tRNA synthetase
LKAPCVVILGEEELKRNKVVLRDMATKAQEEVPMEEIVKWIKDASRKA